MTNIQMIPLSRLVPSPANVRKTGRMNGIDELAASIAAHGLLQNLQVRSGAKGRFEVVAGGRRLAALKLLAKRKAVASTAEIPCHILDGEDAGEISLAENAVRLAMHPADQFEAFHALTMTGKGVEEIAARFGVSAAVVRQRLKLASVSPSLVTLYRDDEMSLDQLMAFTVSDDHQAQEAAWFERPEWQRDPDAIRCCLTAAHVDAGDRRVRFVTLDAYKAAGGGILRDLFQPEHEGYLTDPALLDRLADERLVAEAAKVRAEGWKWVEIVPRIAYDALRRFGRVEPEPLPLSPERQEELDRATAAYEALIELHGEDPEPEIAERLDMLSARIDALSEADAVWRGEDMAVAGVMIGIGHDGSVQIERGLVSAEDRKARLAAETGEAATETGVAPDDGPASLLPARLVEDLTAERTAALRAMLADNETVALAAAAHALALPLFYPYATGADSCLEVRVASRDLRASAERVKESGAAVLLEARRAVWAKRLPEEATALFRWLLTQEAGTVTSLIGFCAALSIDAVQAKTDRAACPRLAHADELATAAGLDMALWWEPTAERYLARVPKALILEAVREGVSHGAADNMAKLKKDALIARAAAKLTGKGWLPAVLRPSSATVSEAGPETLAA